MKTFYHVTLLENWKSIKENGLIPKIGELSKLIDETQKRIYLFPNIEDMENALYNWLGETINDLYGEDIECCSLKITLPDDFPIENGDVEYEVYSYQKIPSQYISFFREE